MRTRPCQRPRSVNTIGVSPETGRNINLRNAAPRRVSRPRGLLRRQLREQLADAVRPPLLVRRELAVARQRPRLVSVRAALVADEVEVAAHRSRPIGALRMVGD